MASWEQILRDSISTLTPDTGLEIGSQEWNKVASEIVEPTHSDKEAEDVAEYSAFIGHSADLWVEYISSTLSEEWGIIADQVVEYGYEGVSC